MSRPDPQRIVAHRGASHDAPENTLAAFDLAWQQGADAIECDVWMTQDKEIVCIHDRTTRRTADTQLDVTTSTLAELRQLDVGSWKGDKWQGERIPTLPDVLAGVPADKGVFVEIKHNPDLLPVLCGAIAESTLSRDRLVILSFHKEVIVESKKLLPDIKTLFLVDVEQNAIEKLWKPSLEEVMNDLDSTGADGLDVAACAILDAQFIAQLHDTGREVHVWTVDDVSKATRYWIDNIDSVTTNRPKLIRKAISELERGKARLRRATSTDSR